MGYVDWITNLIGLILHWEKKLEEAETLEDRVRAEENIKTLRAVHDRATARHVNHEDEESEYGES